MGITLPAAQFGMTRTHFNIGDLPADLPQRDVLQAANAFNDARYHRLTHQQRVFVDSYLSNDFNATKAALEARYTYDEKEAIRIGKRLIKKKYILEAIELGLNYFTETTKLRREDIINEWKKIAFSNVADFFKNDGDGDPYIRMPADDERDKLAAVSEITVRSYNEGRGPAAREVKEIKFKLHDKMGALAKLWMVKDREEGIQDGATSPVAGISAQSLVIQNFNIVPVPTGEFVPAPENPYKVIDHQ